MPAYRPLAERLWEKRDRRKDKEPIINREAAKVGETQEVRDER